MKKIQDLSLQSKTELGILYAIFFLFLAGTVLSGNKIEKPFLALNFIPPVLLIIYLLQSQNFFRLSIGLLPIFIFIYCLVLLAGFIFFPIHLGNILLYLKIILLGSFFVTASISLKDFIGFLNKTYLLYLSISFLIYLQIIPFIFGQQENAFFYTIGPFQLKTLTGLEGSTAHLDSYSGLILFINLFLSEKSRSRNIMIGISFAAAMLTIRFTPLVGLVFGLLCYYFGKRKWMGIGLLFILIGSFIGLLVFMLSFELKTAPNFPGMEINSFLILILATSGRAIIWRELILEMFQQYTLMDYFIGNKKIILEANLKSYFFYESTRNPHNSILLLIFQNAFLFILTAVHFFRRFIRYYHRKLVGIAGIILVGSLTNSAIFSLGNPVFIIVFCAMATGFFLKEPSFSKLPKPMSPH